MTDTDRLAALLDLIDIADTGGNVIHLAVTPTLTATLDALRAERRSAPTRDERWERHVKAQIERMKKAAVG